MVANAATQQHPTFTTKPGGQIRWTVDIYAAANIPEYWVIDIKAGQLKRFHSPAHGQYQETVIAAESMPVFVAGVSIDMAAIAKLAFETE